jgi:hypothetical protein
VLEVSKVKPVIASTTVHTYVNRTQLEEKLKDKTLSQLEAELSVTKYKLCKWEIDVFEALIAQRKALGTKLEVSYNKLGMQACIDEAKKEGVLLTQELRDGKSVLIHPTKGVIYESSVVIH